MYDRPPERRTTTGWGTCDDCNRRVLYALTTAHRRIIPIDPDPDPTGNQAISVRDTTWWTRQLSTTRPRAEKGEVLRRPHYASCPVARTRIARKRAEAARTAAAARRRATGRTTTGVRPVRWQR